MVEVSIVLLTLNGGRGLAESLRAIDAQQTSRPREIVAVDSGSTDGTLELLSQHGARVHSIPPQDFDFGSTREFGYELARGELIVTLSQDAVPASEDWLERLLAPFADPGVAAVGGRPVPPPPPARVFFWERAGRLYYTAESRRWLARYQFGFSNISSAVRKSVWQNNRLGPIQMSEDRLLQKTWTARGLRVVFAPDAIVTHGHDYTLRTLAQRCENEGIGCREIAEPYTLGDSLGDMADLDIWLALARAIGRGARPTLAELSFPIVRPLFLWKGSRFTRHLVRAAPPVALTGS